MRCPSPGCKRCLRCRNDGRRPYGGGHAYRRRAAPDRHRRLSAHSRRNHPGKTRPCARPARPLRKQRMFEPAGTTDMYGALLVEPDLPGADLAVLFMHNEGYSTIVRPCRRRAGPLCRGPGAGGSESAGDARSTSRRPAGWWRLPSGEGRQGGRRLLRERGRPFLFARNKSVGLPGFGEIGFDMPMAAPSRAGRLPQFGWNSAKAAWRFRRRGPPR